LQNISEITGKRREKRKEGKLINYSQ
jgi:hypothetical protein